MKTSNIILLSIFLSILIGGTAFFFLGIYEVKEIINTQGGVIKKLEKQDLNSFSTLVIRGKGYIDITEDSTSNYIQSKEENIFKKVNDTLIINIKRDCRLHCNNIKSIITEGNVTTRLDVISSDTINVYTKDKSYFMVKKLEASYINVDASESSMVRIETIADLQPKARFSLSDNAEMRIQKADNLKMELSKTGDSHFQIY